MASGKGTKTALALGGLGLAGFGLSKLGFFGKKESTFDPMSAYTPEQRRAVEGLQQLAATGSGLGINLGEAYGGSLGNFQSTGIEQQGLAGLQQLLSGGTNQFTSQAAGTLGEIAGAKFDPDDPSSGYGAFSRLLAREGSRASSVLDHEAAITGNRFGTAIIGKKADLAAQLQDQSALQLANLFQSQQGNRLAAAQGLGNIGNQEISRQQQAVRMATELGGLERNLQNQQAQAQYGEFLRQRGEKGSQLDLAQYQMQNPLGPITSTEASPFSQLMGSGFGSAIGGPIGGAIVSSFSSLFRGSGGTTTGTIGSVGSSGVPTQNTIDTSMFKFGGK